MFKIRERSRKVYYEKFVQENKISGRLKVHSTSNTCGCYMICEILEMLRHSTGIVVVKVQILKVVKAPHCTCMGIPKRGDICVWPLEYELRRGVYVLADE